jgi:hypothetical protein
VYAGDKAYDSAELREKLINVEPGRSFQTAATGSGRSAPASVSTGYVGASKLHSTG